MCSSSAQNEADHRHSPSDGYKNGGELLTAGEGDGVIRGEVGVEIVLDLFVGVVVVVVVYFPSCLICHE